MEEKVLDYVKLGFKSGIEIHQQLDTKKLFCNCPSMLRSDEPDFLVSRRLHAVAGESGGIDVAAEYQSSLGKEFVYQGYDSICLVELDEEPPHEINSEALEIALHVALFLNCKIFPITQIMRKTVVDGSNTSGFQRSVIIARDGFIDTKNGRVGIETVALEEDAARIVSREKGKDVYRLDRLGIPLIEIATKPDMKNPEHVKEVALYIGNVLRSCKVKRGIGTIRQDVNVSIKGHPRVEIKGFQDVKMFVKTLENETERQIENVKKKRLVSEVRNALSDGRTEFLRPMPGADRMYPETDLPLLKISRSMMDDAKKNLPRLRTDIAEELKSEGLSEEMIKLLMKYNLVEDYKSLIGVLNIPQLVAKMLLIFPKEISTKMKLELENVNEKVFDYYHDILNAISKNKISEGDVKEVIQRIVDGKSFDEAIKFEKSNLNEIEEKIHNLIKSKPGLNANAYMGLVMQEFKGKINGKEAMEIIRKFVK